MNFLDRLTIDGTRKRSDGALVVDARTARTGVQVYGGFEIGRADMATVRVYRGADQVFDGESLASFAHKPITDDHPREAVTADNWKQYAVGQTADEVRQDGIFVRVPLMVSDGATVSKIEGGKRELSVGYTCDLDFTPGTTPDGFAFDASQKNIRVNHIAVVDSGRAGKDCRIGDSAWIAPMETKDTKPMSKLIILADSRLPLDLTNDAAVEATIRALETKISDLNTSAATIKATHDGALAEANNKIGSLTAEVATLKDAMPNAEKLHQMAADRAALVTLATTVIGDASKITATMSDDDVRRAVVAAKIGDAAVKDANADMIKGMFTAVTKDAKPVAPGSTVDPFRAAMLHQVKDTSPQNDPTGQAAYHKRLNDAWKGAATA